MPLIPSPTILSTDAMGRIAPKIFHAVGRDAENAPGDVFEIQSLLNDRLPAPHSKLPVTGTTDVGTVLAIEAYQAVVMNMIPPSGRVDPDSATYYSLAQRPLVDQKPAISNVHFGQLPGDVIEAARASWIRWKVPVSVTLAQWIVESAWGSAMPPGSNNPFGIKASGDQPAVISATLEVENGQTTAVNASFRRFASLAEAFEEHGRLLATGSAYGTAMQQSGNPEAFADALTGIYATDPKYGFTLRWVMKNYALGQYDQVR